MKKGTSKKMAGVLAACLLLQMPAVFAQPVTMYAVDGRTISVDSSEVDAYSSVGWYTSPPVMMYAPDWRTIYVPQSEVAAYTAVGWYTEPVRYVYAPDGRTAVIADRETSAYLNVGWFTTMEEAKYNNFANSYYGAMNVADYATAMAVCDNALSSGELTAGGWYESDMQAKKRNAADLWRENTRCPIGIVGYTMGENSIGVPTVNIRFRNLSYQPITAFKLTFYCYDAFGNPARWTRYHSNSFDGYINNIWFEPLDQDVWYWTLNLQTSTTYVQNMHITEIVFADGSKWVG